jgi:hypothetical protein
LIVVCGLMVVAVGLQHVDWLRLGIAERVADAVSSMRRLGADGR